MDKIYLIKKFQFASAHRMFNSDFSSEENDKNFGKCQNIHGHNYCLEVSIGGLIDESKGYSVNLYELSNEVKSYIIDVLDHQYLNDILPGCKEKPVTMEIISAWIWKTLNAKLPQYDFHKIRLWESPDNSVEIYK